MKRRNGFTLVELLVVIGIIGVLLSILIPTITRARRQAAIIQCASNLHGIGQSFYIYQSYFAGALPMYWADGKQNPPHSDGLNPPDAVTPYPVSGGNWLCDLAVGTRDAIVKYGASQNIMCCPTTFDYFNPGPTPPGTNTLWGWMVTTQPNGQTIGFGVMGYGFLTWRMEGYQAGTAPVYPGSPTTNPPKVGGTFPNPNTGNALIQPTSHWDYQSSIRPKNTPSRSPFLKTRANISSETEIVFDLIISSLGNFSNIHGGFTGGSNAGAMPSAHTYRGLPDGGNILFLDGHVEFRPFSQMLMRVEEAPPGDEIFYW